MATPDLARALQLLHEALSPSPAPPYRFVGFALEAPEAESDGHTDAAGHALVWFAGFTLEPENRHRKEDPYVGTLTVTLRVAVTPFAGQKDRSSYDLAAVMSQVASLLAHRTLADAGTSPQNRIDIGDAEFDAPDQDALPDLQHGTVTFTCRYHRIGDTVSQPSGPDAGD